MSDNLDFSGKVVLVTGSSRGIGAGLVTAFARRGARCVVNYVDDVFGQNRGDAEQVAAPLRDPLLLQCDVGSAEHVAAMMARIRHELGGLDVLVNNAGILRDRTLAKMTEDEWASVLRVNLTGVFNCIHDAAGLLRDGGRIVNLRSVSGEIGLFGQANYAASKAGIMGLTKVAARELARRKITVNAVAPGFVKTDIHRSMPEDVKQQFLSLIPMHRFGEAEEIVGPVLFLCSPQACYITGQILHVNGGFYM